MSKASLLEMLDTRVAPREFESWRHNVHSQFGEDGIIAHLVGLFGLARGCFVEFGAWDGQYLSNCAALATAGWGGCFIEGDKNRYGDLVGRYRDRHDIVTVNALVTAEGDNALGAILERANVPQEFGVLSVDIDGNDYHVWKALTGYRPAICLVEFNPTVPGSVVFVQEARVDVQQGCSLAALWQLGKEKGYSLVAATDVNAILVADELCKAHGLATYLPQEIKNPQYEAVIFHGYDGAIITGGHRSLLWHSVGFGDDDLQVLPPQLRRFPDGAPDVYLQALDNFKAGR